MVKPAESSSGFEEDEGQKKLEVVNQRMWSQRGSKKYPLSFISGEMEAWKGSAVSQATQLITVAPR